MGTRGTYGLKKDGILKVQYNHLDSYPDELGRSFLSYLKSRTIDELSEVFNKIELVSYDDTPTEEQIKRCYLHDTVDLFVASKSENDWYCLLRNTQGNMELTEKVGIMLGHDYFDDDFSYIFDVDNKYLEFYGYGELIQIFAYDTIKEESLEDLIKLMNTLAYGDE